MPYRYYVFQPAPLYRICFAVTCIFADPSRTGTVRKGVRRILDNPSPRRPFKYRSLNLPRLIKNGTFTALKAHGAG